MMQLIREGAVPLELSLQDTAVWANVFSRLSDKTLDQVTLGFVPLYGESERKKARGVSHGLFDVLVFLRKIIF